MTEEDDDTIRPRRRELLAAAGTATAGILGLASFSTESNRRPTYRTVPESDRGVRGYSPSDGGTGESDGPSDDGASPEDAADATAEAPADAMVITEYGATPDDGTDDTEALQQAAREAGPGGTVYVPPGTYRIGATGSKPLHCDGETLPAGISFVGASPERSVLKWVDADQYDPDADGSPRGVRYADYLDHGDVVIRDLTWDGNWHNLNLNPSGRGSTAFGFFLRGSGSTDFTVERTRWVNWWTNGGIAEHPSSEFTDCWFVNCGLGADYVAGRSGHGFNAVNESGEIVARNCLFRNIAGNAVDHGEGSWGDVRLSNCYVSGVGTALIKKNHSTGTVYLENVYAEIQNDYVPRYLESWEGRWGIYSITSSGDTAGEVHVDNVVISNPAWSAIDIKTPFSLTGPGPLVVRDANESRFRDGAIYVDDERAEIDVATLSVHDTTGGVFDVNAPSVGGTVDLLVRSQNSGGLGETGGLTIGRQLLNSRARHVEVPPGRNVETGYERQWALLRSAGNPSSVLRLDGSEN